MPTVQNMKDRLNERFELLKPKLKNQATLIKSIEDLKIQLLHELDEESLIYTENTWNALEQAVDNVLNKDLSFDITQASIQAFRNTARNSRFSKETKMKIFESSFIFTVAAMVGGLAIALAISNPLGFAVGTSLFVTALIAMAIAPVIAEFAGLKRDNQPPYRAAFFNPKEDRGIEIQENLQKLYKSLHGEGSELLELHAEDSRELQYQ